MGKLDGKVAVITGGNSGIGLETAKLFVAEGAYVYIIGPRKDELNVAVASIGANVTGIEGDVTKLADLDRIYMQVSEEKAHVDILFANAGVGAVKPLGQITEEQFDAVFNVNVRGLLFTVQKVLPHMPNGSSIVLNGSTDGVKGYVSTSVYSASKAAVRSFARTWISELKDRRIRVNVVSPGFTETPIFDTLNLSKQEIDDIRETTIRAIPLGRWGRPEDVANAVLFLASGDSSYINGVELFVDGGLTAI